MMIVPGSAFIPKAAGDSYWPYVVLLMNGHEFEDDSSYNTAITNNSATIDNNYFVGDNNGYFETTDHTENFELFSGDFTIEFELFRTDTLAKGAIIGKIRTNLGGLVSARWLISMGVQSSIYFLVENIKTIDDSQPSVREWHHLAFSYTKSDGVLRYYLDGLLKQSGLVDTNFVDDDSVPLGIMAEDCYGGIPRLGYGGDDCYLRGLRITKGIARYTSDFTPPTVPLPNDM